MAETLLADQPLEFVEPCVPKQAAICWVAFLKLMVGKTSRGTRLLTNEHQGPLYVQKPFYPEGNALAHIYILHPPGGLVSGDSLSIELSAQANTHSLYTTPGAGRVYRARADKSQQSQNVHINIGENSSIEWLPLETIIFSGAVARLVNRIDVASNGHFIGWEITCLGLPASGKQFDDGTFSQQLEIYCDGKPRIIENFHLNATDHPLLTGNMGLRGCVVTALMTAGPFDKGDLDNDREEAELLSNLREITAPSSALLSITQTRGFILIRYLGHCSHEARELLTEAWRLVRPALLGKPAREPRIWAC